ncbi:MAG: Reverse transcriptase (RNA-dependent DNA polymerase) [Pseudobutyrivibrio ruminis]|nr:Reverse transcriptase (RNA-dependent DNA polymerase) [Pseudobutyrivibrio ruminis]
MQRNRMEVHLKKYFYKYHTNKGYILFSDFSKYFDNLDHELLIAEIGKVIKDEAVLNEVKLILDSYVIDGSRMTDEEFNDNIEGVYDSNKYYKRPKIGPERCIHKSVGIGSELSQIAGVYYPTRIDNYVKIVRGCKYYGRYNDDFYIIHPDKEFLIDVFEGIKKIAKEQKLHINERKTRLVKLDKPFVFLKVKYRLSDTGKVTRSYLAETFIRERRKLKKFKKKLDRGDLTMEEIESQYRSWKGHILRQKNKNSKNGKPIYNNVKAVKITDKLFKELFSYLP